MNIKISLPVLLFIVFLVLKLTNLIDWTWYWVTSLILGFIFFSLRIFELLTKKIGNKKMGTESKMNDYPHIKCPKCEMKSYHPDDIKYKYCGNCNEWHEFMYLENEKLMGGS